MPKQATGWSCFDNHRGKGAAFVPPGHSDVGLQLLENSTTTAFGLAVLIVMLAGTILANLMFNLPAATASTHNRSDGHLRLGETVATAGLILLIFSLARTGRTALAAPTVGAYIGAAIGAGITAALYPVQVAQPAPLTPLTPLTPLVQAPADNSPADPDPLVEPLRRESCDA